MSDEQKDGVRLQKFLASAGVASRRRAEELIAAGKVHVNGQVVDRMGVVINPALDKVEVSGVLIRPAEELVYYMLNKPRGYLVTASDTHGRRTVYHLIRDIKERVVPVGRLDMDSEGLLLLTNDGDLTFRLMHPSFEIEKEYYVRIRGRLTTVECARLRQGILMDGTVTQPAQVRVLHAGMGESEAHIVISEGRKRQIRRMFTAVGHDVLQLRRIREGNLKLGLLRQGMWRKLTPAEVADLKHEVERD